MLGEDSQWLSHEKNTNKISSNRSSNTPGHQTMGMENPPFTSMVFPLKKKNKYIPRFPHLYNPDQSSHKCPWTIAGCRSPSPLVDPFRWSTPGPDVDWKGHSIDLTLKWFPCVTSASSSKVSLHASQMTSTARCNPSQSLSSLQQVSGLSRNIPMSLGHAKIQVWAFPTSNHVCFDG